MRRSTKRRAAMGLTAVAVMAGGGFAFAAAKDSRAEEQKALLDNAAKRLDVTPQALGDALKGAFSDQLDKAVADGRLTRAQADAMKKRLEQEGGLPLGGPGRHGGRSEGPRGFGGPGVHGRPGGLDAAAKYLGLNEGELRAKLESGKALAAVARAQGKSVQGLKDTMVDAAKADLDAAVKAGRLTAKQRDAIAKDLAGRIGDLVDGKPARRRSGHPGFGGHGAPGGPPLPPPGDEDEPGGEGNEPGDYVVPAPGTNPA